MAAGKLFVDQFYTTHNGTPYTSTLTYGDYRQLLANPQIDAVLISTPDHQHARLAVAAAQAGKDVYLQKPASLTIREGRTMVDRVAATDRILQIGSPAALLEAISPRLRTRPQRADRQAATS